MFLFSNNNCVTFLDHIRSLCLALIALTVGEIKAKQPFFTSQPYFSSSWSLLNVLEVNERQTFNISSNLPRSLLLRYSFNSFETTLAKNSGKRSPTHLEETRMMKVVALLWRKAGILSFPSLTLSAIKVKQRDFWYDQEMLHNYYYWREMFYMLKLSSLSKHFQNCGTGQPL